LKKAWKEEKQLEESLQETWPKKEKEEIKRAYKGMMTRGRLKDLPKNNQVFE